MTGLAVIIAGIHTANDAEDDTYSIKEHGNL